MLVAPVPDSDDPRLPVAQTLSNSSGHRRARAAQLLPGVRSAADARALLGDREAPRLQR